MTLERGTFLLRLTRASALSMRGANVPIKKEMKIYSTVGLLKIANLFGYPIVMLNMNLSSAPINTKSVIIKIKRKGMNFSIKYVQYLSGTA